MIKIGVIGINLKGMLAMKNDLSQIQLEISKKVKEIRENNGYSKRELGKLIGVDERQIRRIENLENMPTIPTLISIANALDVPLKSLIP